MTAKLKAATVIPSSWDQATLLINGNKVERGAKVVLRRGQDNIVTVEASLAIAKKLNLGLVHGGDLIVDAMPKVGDWVSPDAGTFKWTITPGLLKSGRITLVFFSREVNVPWVHQSVVVSSNLAAEATVYFDGTEIPENGVNLFGGETKKITLVDKNGNLLDGIPLALDWVPGQGLEYKDLVSEPPLREFSTGHEWAITGAEKEGTFRLKIFNEGEQTALQTPTNRLVSAYRLRYLALMGGEYVEIPQPPIEVGVVIGIYFMIVRVRKSDNSPVEGATVTFNVPGFSPQSKTTNADGIASSPFSLLIPGKRECSAVMTSDGREYVTRLLLDVLPPN
ncbi:Ig-like domain-containing protein [Pseudomonas laurylsulfatiphila]|uniref:Ig-like domain-containing protein n=1 Tax=Pseudomonas laurylsulfatiphila TaxID=2011015 RepID=UPI003D1CE430|nr:hypothetical protein [Pseudomonas reinekei]MDF9906800.1 hypothetical protein [Pseudomonas reinekei]